MSSAGVGKQRIPAGSEAPAACYAGSNIFCPQLMSLMAFVRILEIVAGSVAALQGV